MKLTIKENDDNKYRKYKKGLKETKILKEGPGAGYTINVDGLSNINFNSASLVEYIEEVGWIFNVSGSCTIDKLWADSYYYGTGYLYDVPANITKVFVNWYWVDEEADAVSNFSESELIDWLNSYGKDRIESGKFDFHTNFGGGWMHSTYDGTINALDNEDGDVNLTITDKDIINYIDIAVQGENTYEEFRVMCNDSFDGEIYDTEEEAIEAAKKAFYSQADGIDDEDYDIFTDGDTYSVVKTTGYYYYDGEIDDYSNDEIVWESSDLEE